MSNHDEQASSDKVQDCCAEPKQFEIIKESGDIFHVCAKCAKTEFFEMRIASTRLLSKNDVGLAGPTHKKTPKPRESSMGDDIG